MSSWSHQSCHEGCRPAGSGADIQNPHAGAKAQSVQGLGNQRWLRNGLPSANGQGGILIGQGPIIDKNMSRDVANRLQNCGRNFGTLGQKAFSAASIKGKIIKHSP
jgi:hypothetical protein